MDPNTALAVLRCWTSCQQRGTENKYATTDDAVEAFAALDEWLTRGGHLPTPWDTPPRSHTG